MISITSYCFKVFFSCQHRTRGVLCEFLWFFGVRLDICYALTEFSMHLCAKFKFELHAYAPVHMNWLKNQICVLGCMLRSQARNGNECPTPGHRWLPAKHWDAWFLNSSKSKTRLKFMKLGMLSWSGINMTWYKFCPIWGRFGYMLLTNQSFSQQAWWFR